MLHEDDAVLHRRVGRQLVRTVDEVNLRTLPGLLRVKRLIEVLRIEVAHLVVIIVDIHLLLPEERPGTDRVDRAVRERIHTILIEEEKDVRIMLSIIMLHRCHHGPVHHKEQGERKDHGHPRLLHSAVR